MIPGLILRAAAAAVLWLCCALCAPGRDDAWHLRVALEAGLLAQQGPDSWLAARDWGLATRVRDPAREQRQRRHNDCGPSSLCRILRQRNLPIVDRLLPTPSRRGCTLADLQNAAQRSGLVAQLVQVARPTDIRPPAILHLRRRHFVVLEQRRGSVVRLFDPGHGVIAVRSAALLRQCSGAVLRIEGPAALRRPPGDTP